MAVRYERSLRQRLGVLAFAFLLVLAFTVTANVRNATVAQAHCYGASCAGLDPNGTGCNDSRAYTVSYAAVGSLGWVYEIYSPDCASNWTFSRANSTQQVIKTTAWNCTDHAMPRCDGVSGYQEGNSYGLTYGWSPMVNGIPIAQSCAFFFKGGASACAYPV